MEYLFTEPELRKLDELIDEDDKSEVRDAVLDTVRLMRRYSIPFEEALCEVNKLVGAMRSTYGD